MLPFKRDLKMAELLPLKLYPLTLLHSEQPKLHRVLAVLSAIGLIKQPPDLSDQHDQGLHLQLSTYNLYLYIYKLSQWPCVFHDPGYDVKLHPAVILYMSLGI